MVRITLSRDLDPVPFGGWETNVATAFDDVFVSGNWFAAYSSDGGSSWVTLNPKKLQAETPGAFCDQRVLYIPQINRFAWVIMTDTEGGLNEITLAISEPVQLQDSNGRAWLRYHIWPRTVRQDDQAFDYPDISFGDSYL